MSSLKFDSGARNDLAFDLGFSLLLVVAAGVVYVDVGKIVQRQIVDPLGPVRWPRGVAIALAAFVILAFGLRVREALIASRARHDDVMKTTSVALDAVETSHELQHSLEGYLRIGASVVITAVYVYFVPRIGYFITTTMAVAALMHLMGARSFQNRVVFPVGLTVMLWITFAVGLKVRFPAPIWFGF